jgi:DNA-binding transcriptional LysR family regulator
MPGTIGHREVIPRLPDFLALHSQLRVQVVLEDQRQDLVRDAVDVSIRPGKLADAGATAQRLTSLPRVVLAARSYVDHAGAPATSKRCLTVGQTRNMDQASNAGVAQKQLTHYAVTEIRSVTV